MMNTRSRGSEVLTRSSTLYTAASNIAWASSRRGSPGRGWRLVDVGLMRTGAHAGQLTQEARNSGQELGPLCH